MTALALLRHGPTDWNKEGRIQGHTDIPLSESGRAEVAGWNLPTQFQQYAWVASPLLRTRETARLLGAPEDMATDPVLMEMNWGEWEGATLTELRKKLGDEMAENEGRGLDFRPVGGESPRDVQMRLYPWLKIRAQLGAATLAVSHKGVIRAILAAATGWDMIGKPPFRLSWNRIHLFSLAPDGSPSIDRLNIALRKEP